MTETATARKDVSDGGSVIVVGYSAKPEGKAALQRAVAEAQLRNARLIVVHTSPDAEVDELTVELDAARRPVRGEGRRRTPWIRPRS